MKEENQDHKRPVLVIRIHDSFPWFVAIYFSPILAQIFQGFSERLNSAYLRVASPTALQTVVSCLLYTQNRCHRGSNASSPYFSSIAICLLLHLCRGRIQTVQFSRFFTSWLLCRGRVPVTRRKLLLRKDANCYQAWWFYEIHICLQGGTQTSTITLRSKQSSRNYVCHTAELGLLYMKSSSDSYYGFHSRKPATGSVAG